jgi:hypothetical protein
VVRSVARIWPLERKPRFSTHVPGVKAWMMCTGRDVFGAFGLAGRQVDDWAKVTRAKKRN